MVVVVVVVAVVVVAVVVAAAVVVSVKKQGLETFFLFSFCFFSLAFVCCFPFAFFLSSGPKSA